ncbi:MAG: flagellar motor switch protein FliN [Bacillus sp. (in: Bacteria)]|nr:flagellar motor switch protein FliN [Bacillus sp. (in: firmicutes)]
MKENELSPDEIKALLGLKEEVTKTVPNSSISNKEKEVLHELFSLSLGGSCQTLSKDFNQEVEVTALKLTTITKEEFLNGNLPTYYMVISEFSGGVNGRYFLTISAADAENLKVLLVHSGQTDSLNKEEQVIEAVLQPILQSVIKTLGTILNVELYQHITGLDVVTNPSTTNLDSFTEEHSFVKSGFSIKVGVDKEVIFNSYIPERTAKQVVNLLVNQENLQEVEEMPFQSMDPLANNENKKVDAGVESNIQSVQFSNFNASETTDFSTNNLNMLLDIPLQVTVELGRTKRMVKEVLEISQGSIIELDKLAGEPVDILVNNKLIAVGEVVVIDENFGVRVTEIVSKLR